FTMNGAHLRFPARAGIEVFVSASGPKTLELAGRVADGVILLVGLFPEALGWAVSQVERGAQAAGRPRPHIAVFAYGAIDEDELAAPPAPPSIPPWFPPPGPGCWCRGGVPGALVDGVGAGDSGGEFRGASAAAAVLPDEFVRKVALAGNRQHAAERIGAALSAGADSVHVFPLGAER